ncbi:MAG: P-II family nitrogen regulator [Promethearchaeota archaeon]
MKKIEAIVRNDKLSIIKGALADSGFSALTTYEVKGRGKQSGIIQILNDTKIYADLLPKTKIEIIVKSEDLEKVLSLIIVNARTGMIGDGKIFVSDIRETIRIRDGTRATINKEII